MFDFRLLVRLPVLWRSVWPADRRHAPPYRGELQALIVSLREIRLASEKQKHAQLLTRGLSELSPQFKGFCNPRSVGVSGVGDAVAATRPVGCLLTFPAREDSSDGGHRMLRAVRFSISAPTYRRLRIFDLQLMR
jgi:hypothetical protein